MGGKEHLHASAQPLAEEEVARLGSVRALEDRAALVAADLLERARDAFGIARELDRRRVSQELALSAHRGFDQVAEKRADVAAIDCVSFQFIEDRWPELTARVRSIGDSIKTCGLPLVLPNANFPSTDTQQILVTLNKALNQVNPRVRQQLHLSHFARVNFGDYQSILEIESFANNVNYHDLN